VGGGVDADVDAAPRRVQEGLDDEMRLGDRSKADVHPFCSHLAASCLLVRANANNTTRVRQQSATDKKPPFLAISMDTSHIFTCIEEQSF
uniref:Uncharacterized protein n=1 Tax=Steinernema glaseri TaxID=37863 RepID=A0A1I7XXQ1_9BILA